MRDSLHDTIKSKYVIYLSIWIAYVAFLETGSDHSQGPPKFILPPSSRNKDIHRGPHPRPSHGQPGMLYACNQAIGRDPVTIVDNLCARTDGQCLTRTIRHGERGADKRETGKLSSLLSATDEGYY